MLLTSSLMPSKCAKRATGRAHALWTREPRDIEDLRLENGRSTGSHCPPPADHSVQSVQKLEQ